MPIFQRKPKKVEAIQWNGENDQEILDFLGLNSFVFMVPSKLSNGELSKALRLETPKRIMCASKGDWVIKESNGDFSVCSFYAFERDYEKVN